VGWIFRRQKGSHMILTKQGSVVSLSIPDHKELAPGTLRKLIRLSGLTVAEFEQLLK
jgi:predicted RNA binding protein YcfA (HicA-like mRNA interferase family)